MNRRTRQTRQNQRGVALMGVVILLAIMGITAGAALRYFHLHFEEYRDIHRAELAQSVAESGLEKAVALLRANSAYTGEENTPVGEGRFTVTVSPGQTPGTFHLRSSATWGDIAARPRPVAMSAWLKLDSAGQVLGYGLVEGER